MSAQFEVKAFGQDALLISSDRSLVGYQKLASTFGRTRVGMASLLIEGIDPRRANEVADALAAAVPEDSGNRGKSHKIQVRYDGADLTSVADLLGITVAELVATHSSVQWSVAMVGFAPGFAYLTTTETDLFDRIPRLEKPRPKVPAGAVAVAAGMSAVYPSASPGGWQLIGTSDVQLFDAGAQQPSLLLAGDLVRFESS